MPLSLAALKAVTPVAGPPGTQAYLWGDSTWQLTNQDCAAQNWGDVSCVGSIMFGDWQCRQDPSNADTTIQFFDWNYRSRWGSYLYRVGCTLPVPDASKSQVRVGSGR